MNRLVRLVQRDLRVMNRSLLVIQLVLPLFLLFVASFPFTALIEPFRLGGETVTYQRFLASGLIAQTTMTGALIGGTLLFTDRRHGMFEQILAGPYRRGEYAASKVVSSVLVGLGGAAIVAIFGLPFTFGVALTPGGLLVAVAAVLAGAFLFAGVSVILASRFRSLEAFEGTFNLLLILLTFVSSALYPLDAVPPVLRGIMLLNPLTYAVDLVRLGVLGLATSTIAWEAAALAVESALVFLAALRAFARIRVEAS